MDAQVISSIVAGCKKQVSVDEDDDEIKDEVWCKKYIHLQNSEVFIGCILSY